jgi:hypothetical protein
MAGGEETESGRASYYCTARVSVTSMSTATLNEAVLTLYFVYYVSWHCTVSVDDCLLGGSILSEIGVSQSFILHHQTV